MFEFIKIQYLLGHIGVDQVNSLVGKYITEEEATTILESK